MGAAAVTTSTFTDFYNGIICTCLLGVLMIDNFAASSVTDKLLLLLSKVSCYYY